MSPTPRHPSNRTAFEELTDDPITFFGVIVLALMILPGVIPSIRDTAVTWLLAHHAVVPAAEASLTIPLTSVGLDARRIVVAGLLLAAVAALLIWRRARGRRRANGGQP